MFCHCCFSTSGSNATRTDQSRSRMGCASKHTGTHDQSNLTRQLLYDFYMSDCQWTLPTGSNCHDPDTVVTYNQRNRAHRPVAFILCCFVGRKSDFLFDVTAEHRSLVLERPTGLT